MGPDFMGLLSSDGHKQATTRSCDRSFKMGVMRVEVRDISSRFRESRKRLQGCET